ncbi:MAG: phospholipid carrier-dependent glycosyltransferase [Actinomycetota bacterium]|nr:phospholipid carrier-dependent glycosyltransferase [Actinomycetota bacterium]
MTTGAIGCTVPHEAVASELAQSPGVQQRLTAPLWPDPGVPETLVAEPEVRAAPASPDLARPRGARLLSRLEGPLGAALVAVAITLLASWFSASHHLMFLYADARSHLTISRRLIDGPNAGMVQFGTVWLPLPHAIMVPFVMSRWLWHTGLAAVPVGAVCLAIEALSVRSIVRRMTGSRLAAWCALLLLVTNPSVLYLHTTALTEAPLFAAMALTVAALVRWSTVPKAHSGGEIALFCGLPATAALLSRYDGWAFVFVAAAVMFVVAWHRWGNLRYALKVTGCFVVLPCLAAAWWMWFNFVNWGDPLEFQRGPYSAQAQQALLSRQGKLPDKGHLLRSLDTYSTAVWRGCGSVLIVLAAIGAVCWLWTHARHRSDSSHLMPWLLVVVPFTFYVLSLATGQIALRLDDSPTQGMFNLRYGVEMVMGLTVFAGVAVAALQRMLRRRTVTKLSVAVLVAAAVWATAGSGWTQIPVVEEGLSQRAAGVDQYAAGEWMGDHARTGRILIDDSVNPLLPVIDVDLDRVAAPFSRSWKATLADPARAEWVYVDTGNPFDHVRRAIGRDRSFGRDFARVFHTEKADVYRRRPVKP